MSRRIREAEKDVRRLVVEERERIQVTLPQNRLAADPENQQRNSTAEDGGSDDDLSDDDDHSTSGESFDALEDLFHGLEEEVANLVADVHDLALYTKLNITGFMKILKACIFISYSIPGTHAFSIVGTE